MGKISNLKRKRTHGFLVENRKRVIMRRIKKGRKSLSV